MSRFTPLAVAFAACAFAPARGAAGEDFAVWEKALASHPLKDAAGNVVRLSDLKGDVVVVSFWASWCKPCKKELVALDGWLAEATQARSAPRVLAVSVDQDERKAMRFIQDAALRLPVYMDGPDGLARALDLPSLPLTLVLDRNGHVVHVAKNGSTEELTAMQRTVRALLSEAPPARVPAAQEQNPDDDGEVTG